MKAVGTFFYCIRAKKGTAGDKRPIHLDLSFSLQITDERLSYSPVLCVLDSKVHPALGMHAEQTRLHKQDAFTFKYGVLRQQGFWWTELHGLWLKIIFVLWNFRGQSREVV